MYNGFQHLPISDSFIRDLYLYDEGLFVWRGDDGYYRLSHDYKRKDKTEKELYLSAKKNEVMKIQDEDGNIRLPGDLDLIALTRNDMSRVKVKDFIARLNKPREEMEKRHKKELEDIMRQSILDLKRDMSLHPHKY